MAPEAVNNEHNQMNKTKKNAEWYFILPEPFRMQAIENAEHVDMLGKEASSLAASLFAFPWESTKEGHDYWKSVYERVVAGEFGEDW